jgi:uncharacterized membrane protein YeaQ/YmgE (transglycosylase-associated protein family)
MLVMMGWSQKMSLASLLLLLITAASLGNMSRSFSERNRWSCLGSVMVSLLGAFLGFWLAHHFGYSDLIPGTNQATISPVPWAVMGSILFSILTSMISRTRQFFLKRFKPSTVADPVRKSLATPKP